MFPSARARRPALFIAWFIASAISALLFAMLPREDVDTGINDPGDNGFLRDTFLDSVSDLVFFEAIDFSEKNQHLAVRVLLGTQGRYR